uniref:LRAT domain-containing protein n=1 Tax=Palpitomonas bilix TaxID=652834 RepID=A0A7S3DF82_9EUKA|mmetsp:Transcript_35066/g.90962  ORF Transcript_35066/g.90962 Transcript_35066/m.90962 type:complete len:272 (+) Transcript_35066:440-1255(+)
MQRTVPSPQEIGSRFNEVAQSCEHNPNPSLPPLVASASDIQEVSIVKWKRDVGGGISYYHFAVCAHLQDYGKVVVGEVTGGQEGFNNFLQDKRDARVQLAEYSLYSSKFKGAEFDSVTRDPRKIRKICNRLSTGLVYWNTIAEMCKEEELEMQTMYNLVVSNCEHFARWVFTGKWCSKQVEGVSAAVNSGITAIDTLLEDCTTSAIEILEGIGICVEKRHVKRTIIGGVASAGVALGCAFLVNMLNQNDQESTDAGRTVRRNGTSRLSISS